MIIKCIRIIFVITSVLLLWGCESEKRAWQYAEKQETIEAYQDFISKYKKGALRAKAQDRIEKLARANVPLKEVLNGKWRAGARVEQIIDTDKEVVSIKYRGRESVDSSFEIKTTDADNRTITFTVEESSNTDLGFAITYDVTYECKISVDNSSMACKGTEGAIFPSQRELVNWQYVSAK